MDYLVLLGILFFNCNAHYGSATSLLRGSGFGYQPGQKEFVIAMASGAAGGVKGTMEELEQLGVKRIHSNIIPKIPGSKLVWGPSYSTPKGILTAKAKYYTNGVSVIQTAADDFAISIAGTNSGLAGWVLEDLDTRPVQKWDKAPDGAFVFAGFHRGLEIIMSSKPSEGIPGEGLDLFGFVKSRCSGQECKISVQGHSLGGALAPLLALRFAEEPSFSNAKISCTFFAGPTVGNKLFVDYYTSKLGSVTKRFDNSLDAIPRGYDKLSTIPSLYADSLSLSVSASLKINALKVALQADVLGLDPTPIDGASFPAWTGSYNPDCVKAGDDFTSFMKQVLFQHVAAYVQHFGYTLNDFELPTEC